MARGVLLLWERAGTVYRAGEMGPAYLKDGRNGAGAQQLGVWRLGRTQSSFTETALIFLLAMGAPALCVIISFFFSPQLSFPFWDREFGDQRFLG